MKSEISRKELRGQNLDDDCKTANIAENEYGEFDNRCFCYGLTDCSTESYLEKCIKCGAFVSNAKPLKDHSDAISKKDYRDEKDLFMERECSDFEVTVRKTMGVAND